MKYIKAIWFHNHSDEPVLLYSELDQMRYETRKVEIYRNNMVGYADNNIEFNSTALGDVPIPDIEEINKNNQFYVIEISKEEFEVVWKNKDM